MFIALGLSMDAFAVAVCKGLAQTKFRLFLALSVAICFGFFQAAMTTVGYFAGSLFVGHVADFSHWIAFVLLTIIGGKMVYGALSRDKRDDGCETKKSSDGFFGLILLGIATSIDALAVGVNFGIGEDVNILFAAGIIGLTTFFISFFGVCFGKLLGKYLAKYAELAGGIILIVIGIQILLGGFGG